MRKIIPTSAAIAIMGSSTVFAATESFDFCFQEHKNNFLIDTFRSEIGIINNESLYEQSAIPDQNIIIKELLGENEIDKFEISDSNLSGFAKVSWTKSTGWG